MAISRLELKARRKESAAVLNEINRLMRRAINEITAEVNTSTAPSHRTFDEVRQTVRKLAIEDMQRIERESAMKLTSMNLQWIKAASVYFSLNWTPGIDRKVQQIVALQMLKSLDGVRL